MSEITDWVKSLPLFTRYWFGLTVLFTLLGRFGIINPYYLVLLYEPFIHQFQIWRPITALFYYPLTPATGFHFLINLYFLYSYSLRLETGIFTGKPADYCFMLLFNWLSCVLIGLFTNMPVLMDPMVLSVLYIWCMLNKEVIVNFWFGTQFKAMYLPWVLLAFNVVISGGGLKELIGILVGHLYFYLMIQYPQEYGGPSLLTTPSFLYSYFPNQRGAVHGFGQPTQGRPAAAQPNQPPAGPRRYDWGQGHRLID